MKLLFDNNISLKLPDLFAEEFPGSRHVFDLNVLLKSDKWIIEYAQHINFAIVTKDKDFYHLLNTIGRSPKVIWISTGNCSNQLLIQILTNITKQIKLFLSSSRSLLVIE